MAMQPLPRTRPGAVRLASLLLALLLAAPQSAHSQHPQHPQNAQANASLEPLQTSPSSPRGGQRFLYPVHDSLTSGSSQWVVIETWGGAATAARGGRHLEVDGIQYGDIDTMDPSQSPLPAVARVNLGSIVDAGPYHTASTWIVDPIGAEVDGSRAFVAWRTAGLHDAVMIPFTAAAGSLGADSTRDQQEHAEGKLTRTNEATTGVAESSVMTTGLPVADAVVGDGVGVSLSSLAPTTVLAAGAASAGGHEERSRGVKDVGGQEVPTEPVSSTTPTPTFAATAITPITALVEELKTPAKNESFPGGLYAARFLGRKDCQRLLTHSDKLTRPDTEGNAQGNYMTGTYRTAGVLEFGPVFQNLILDVLHRHMLPLVERLYHIPTANLYPADVYIVKYTAADGLNHMHSHQDMSIFTFIILLSDPAQFTGGGTYFHAPGGDGAVAVLGRQGDATLQRGGLIHGGVPITTGERTVLVGFINVVDHDREVVYRAKSWYFMSSNPLRRMTSFQYDSWPLETLRAFLDKGPPLRSLQDGDDGDSDAAGRGLHRHDVGHGGGGGDGATRTASASSVCPAIPADRRHRLEWWAPPLTECSLHHSLGGGHNIIAWAPLYIWNEAAERHLVL